MEDKNKAIVKAKEVLEKISQDEREIYLAELREKHIRDQKAIEAFGIEQGMQEGSDKATKSIAKKMKEDKIETEIICRYTGLTKEEIEKL